MIFEDFFHEIRDFWIFFGIYGSPAFDVMQFYGFPIFQAASNQDFVERKVLGLLFLKPIFLKVWSLFIRNLAWKWDQFLMELETGTNFWLGLKLDQFLVELETGANFWMVLKRGPFFDWAWKWNQFLSLGLEPIFWAYNWDQCLSLWATLPWPNSTKMLPEAWTFGSTDTEFFNFLDEILKRGAIKWVYEQKSWKPICDFWSRCAARRCRGTHGFWQPTRFIARISNWNSGWNKDFHGF